MQGAIAAATAAHARDAVRRVFRACQIIGSYRVFRPLYRPFVLGCRVVRSSDLEQHVQGTIAAAMAAHARIAARRVFRARQIIGSYRVFRPLYRPFVLGCRVVRSSDLEQHVLRVASSGRARSSAATGY